MNKKILVVDDSQFFQKQIARTLEAVGYEVVVTSNGNDGLRLAAAEKPDLVLLDIEMADMSGLEVCKILRQSESNNLMPIIMLTAVDDLDNKLVGLERGADDYITKPFNERELLSRIRNTLLRIERNRLASPLTGLPGNAEIQREINSRIARNTLYAVVYIDLDNFKSYNDVYGFAMGDKIIKLTADIILKHVRSLGNTDDFVGHIGGDDFVFITTPNFVDAICKECILDFDDKIKDLFKPEDLANGYISTVNRRGIEEKFPITSLSLCVVTNEHRTFTSHLEISAVSSELKKKVKAIPGSSYLIDKRQK